MVKVKDVKRSELKSSPTQKIDWKIYITIRLFCQEEKSHPPDIANPGGRNPTKINLDGRGRILGRDEGRGFFSGYFAFTG
jgi:hypothetical protein